MRINKSFVLLCVGFCLLSVVKSENDNDMNGLISALEADPSISQEILGGLNTFSDESEPKSVGGSFAINKSPLHIFQGVGQFFGGQLEIVRLVEAFLEVTGELLSHFLALFYDNWDVIWAICNLIVSKAPKLFQSLVLGVSVLRKILEFAVGAFAAWNVSLV